MSKWNEAAHWGFGHGFWYTDPMEETKGLSEEQLFWVPHQKSLCALWHIGHIAHRERFHIGVLLQGQSEREIIPGKYDIFGVDWCAPEPVRERIDDVDEVKEWFRQVRKQSHDFISGLTDEDYHKVPPFSVEGNSVAKVLYQTVGHTALHIGRIQMLRAMIENNNERAC